MEVAMPMSGTAMDCYEDMFKEITRKLYGEDGLPDLTGSTGGGGTIGANATTNNPNSERTSHGLTAIDYDVEGGSGPTLKPEEHLTAFGLAALMQNGFPGAAAAGILNTAPFHHHHHHHHPTSHHLQQQQALHASTANTNTNNHHNNTSPISNGPKQQQNPSANSQQPQQQNYEDKWIISEDSIPWTQSKIATYNPAQKLFRCAECDCVGYLPRVAEHWLGTHSNLRVFQCPQCPYESAWARCVRMHLTRQHNINIEDATDALLKNNPVLQEVTRYLQRLKSRLETNCSKPQSSEESYHGLHQQQQQPASTTPVSTGRQNGNITTPAANESNGKRYSCTYCPYATDRRDLFTRHENIHREEKPFQCYVCQKQFNRADHVKKHFLRMHREHPYDLNRIRRHPPKNASGMSYYQKYNNNGNASGTGNNVTGNGNNGVATTSSQEQVSQVTAAPVSVPPPLPIPVSSVPVAIPEAYHNSAISIPNTFNTVNRNNVTKASASHPTEAPKATKSNPNNKSSKKKSEKRFSCCYCSWSGVDNWCLKRHMNTHLKPFVCALCDYKAARSERLATHVLKVHNKRACGKCNYLAENSTQLMVHQQENHPSNRNASHSSSNVLRNTTFANSISSTTSTLSQQSGVKVEPPNSVGAMTSATGASTASMLHNNRLAQTWKPHNNSNSTSINPNLSQHGDQTHQGHLGAQNGHQNHHSGHGHHHHHHGPKQHGAARLFNYMEASDGSENECDSPRGPPSAAGAATEEIARLSHRIESDFPEAGDVGTANSNLHHHHHQQNNCHSVDGLHRQQQQHHHQQHELMLPPHQQQHQQQQHLQQQYALEEDDDGLMEEPELPLFVCRQCGCEFEDDGSLETHSLVHRSQNNTSTSPAKPNNNPTNLLTQHDFSNDCIKENINPNYTCQYCDLTFASQASIIIHMQTHTTLTQWGMHSSDRQEMLNKQRSRKQSQPRKLSALEASENRTKQRKLELYRQTTRRYHFRCYKCKTISKEFSSLASFIVHKYYFHGSQRQFQCEHCPQKFRHKYQMVIHGAKMHVPNQGADPTRSNIIDTVDATHKIAMAYFDHSSGTVNGHMPIVIPTFPPI